MKRVLFFLILFTCLVELARADFCSKNEWDTTDKVLLTSAIVADVIDWRQTQQIVKNPTRYHEQNILLGDHPSMGELNRYAIMSIASTVLIADCLPSNWRKTYLGTVIAIEVYTIHNNHNIGIRFGF